MSTDVFPFAVWLSGTNQNSIPANDNALRVEVLTGPALSILSAQPSSPAEGDQHIIGAAPSGAQWASFAEDDVVIYKGGTWLAFSPYQGWLKFNADDGDTYQWDGEWAVFAGGGGSSAWVDLTGVPQPVLDIAALTDPGGDRLVFWDDSAGAYTHLTLGTNLAITGTTLNATGGSSGVSSVNGDAGPAVVLDTDDVGEGSSNLYFTPERVDDRVAALLVAGANVTLTYNDASNSLTIAAAGGGAAGGINTQSGTSYTLVLADAGKTVTMANAAANVLTVPPNSSVALPVGSQVGVMMNGAGQTSVAPGAGVTISTIETLQLLKQGAVAVLEQIATDVWRLTGELRPSIPTYRSRQRFDPANTTTPGTVSGVVFTSSGTVSHQALATTSLQSALRRTRWATTAAASQTCGIVEAAATKVRGNAVGIGGFRVEVVFDQASNVTGHQAFVGLAASTATLGGDPSALTNMVGMGYDSADANSGNWQLMMNDAAGTATRVDLGTGAARNATDVYSLTISSPQNGSSIVVTVVNVTTGVTVLDSSYSADIPSNTAFLGVRAQIRTGATTTAAQLEVATIDVGYQE